MPWFATMSAGSSDRMTVARDRLPSVERPPSIRSVLEQLDEESTGVLATKQALHPSEGRRDPDRFEALMLGSGSGHSLDNDAGTAAVMIRHHCSIITLANAAHLCCARPPATHSMIRTS